MSEDDVPVEVFSGPYAEVLFLQSLLESAGIITSVSEHLRGKGVHFGPGLLVRRADAEHAAELVADFRKNGHRTSY
jgi:hypothetical protein